jgi:hypothetical protein
VYHLFPHRPPSQIQQVLGCASVITWAELVVLLPDQPPGSPEQAAAAEVRRRIEPQPPGSD